MAFAGPAVLLLVAAGLPVSLAWLRQRARWGCLVLAGLALFPAAQAVYRVASPWPRFDSARAADLVRARCRPGDAVVGTAWEHEYYFRDRREAFRYLHLAPKDPPVAGTAREEWPHRLWLLAAGKTAEERRGYVEELEARGWVIAGRQELERTTVFQLEWGKEHRRIKQVRHSPMASCVMDHWPLSPSGGRSGPPRSRP
jgi:hypothetical protein